MGRRGGKSHFSGVIGNFLQICHLVLLIPMSYNELAIWGPAPNCRSWWYLLLALQQLPPKTRNPPGPASGRFQGTPKHSNMEGLDGEMQGAQQQRPPQANSEANEVQRQDNLHANELQWTSLRTSPDMPRDIHTRTHGCTFL